MCVRRISHIMEQWGILYTDNYKLFVRWIMKVKLISEKDKYFGAHSFVSIEKNKTSDMQTVFLKNN